MFVALLQRAMFAVDPSVPAYRPSPWALIFVAVGDRKHRNSLKNHMNTASHAIFAVFRQELTHGRDAPTHGREAPTRGRGDDSVRIVVKFDRKAVDERTR